eukprot:TRINITY_DN909_c0_g1_i1.p1 TRINITY_DN909_c0_g1~~TRINITY_DN909_c0_g1_i1.p1  ORF type:complete len:247 (-),score=86.74 TRINITY_DN909_c0_g1_i1:21-761(-)
MPCYDKKLEASREDFTLAEYNNTKEVDCVLTTIELEEIIQDKGVDLKQLKEFEGEWEGKQWCLTGGEDKRSIWNGSGGYLETVLRAINLLKYNGTATIVEEKGRNEDYRIVKLELNGEEKLRAAYAYGFRNIQNIVRTLKLEEKNRKGKKTNTASKKKTLDFIEVMACPKGCLNGGGQLKVEGKQGLEGVGRVYNEVQEKKPEEDEMVKKIYKEWIGGEIGSESARKLLHTQYKAVEKVNNVNIKW